jgi:thiol-disulfide isomerase/thioredoxin
MLDLECEWASVDVANAVGTIQNVTARVKKWPLDVDGIRQSTEYKHEKQRDIHHTGDTQLTDDNVHVARSLEELYANGKDAIPFDEISLDSAQDANKYVFVNFYDPFSTPCQQLSPTWEALAELLNGVTKKRQQQNGVHTRTLLLIHKRRPKRRIG